MDERHCITRKTLEFIVTFEIDMVVDALMADKSIWLEVRLPWTLARAPGL